MVLPGLADGDGMHSLVSTSASQRYSATAPELSLWLQSCWCRACVVGLFEDKFVQATSAVVCAPFGACAAVPAKPLGYVQLHLNHVGLCAADDEDRGRGPRIHW